MGWRDDLNYGLAAFGIQIPDRFDLDKWVEPCAENPAAKTTALLGVSSALFLLAERGHNPKVNDIYDAMVYCSTCFSVGYADIFPRTPVGKLIGSILMIVGPAMTNKFLDGPSNERRDAQQAEVLDTLKQILHRLETQSPLDPSPPPPSGPS